MKWLKNLKAKLQVGGKGGDEDPTAFAAPDSSVDAASAHNSTAPGQSLAAVGPTASAAAMKAPSGKTEESYIMGNQTLPDFALLGPAPLGPSFDNMHAALTSAAASEPASVASTTRLTSAENSAQLFQIPAVKHVGTDLYSRVLMPASQASLPANAYPGSQPNSGFEGAGVVVTPCEPASASAQPPAEEPRPGNKLTAAALGTHATLGEGAGAVRQQRGSRKMHFIKSWLQEAEDETLDPTTAQPHHQKGPGSASGAPHHQQHAAQKAQQPELQYQPQHPHQSFRQQQQPPQQPPVVASLPPPAVPGYPQQYQLQSGTLPKLQVQPQLADRPSNQAGAAIAGAGTSGDHLAGSRRVSGTATGSPLAHASSQEISMHTALHGAHGGSDACLPRLNEPGAALQDAKLAGMPGSGAYATSNVSLVTTAATKATNSAAAAADPSSEQASASARVQPQVPDASVTPAAPAVAHGSSAAVLQQAGASGKEGATKEGSPAGQPKRLAADGVSSVPPGPPHHGLRLPPAPPERTRTIAVASHCPEDLLTQQWTVDDYILLRKLYEGNLSVICQAQHKRSGRHVALKIYKRSRLHEMERFQLAREICLHIRILHPYIISLYAAWKDSKYVFLVLEWAPHGNLFDLLVSRGGKLPEVEAATLVIKPLFTALAFLHSQNFIHRDIKLENIVMDANNQMKLCDFGLAIDQKFEQANTRLGTFGYFAPEVLDCPLKKSPFDYKGDPSVPSYDAKVDCWSAGVVAYELLTGKAPFSASSAAKILDAIRNRVLEYPSDLSDGARSFLSAALTRDPTRRATAKQLMQHPWIAACTAAAASNSSLSSYTATSASTLMHAVPHAQVPMPVQAVPHVPAPVPMAVQQVPVQHQQAGAVHNSTTAPR